MDKEKFIEELSNEAKKELGKFSKEFVFSSGNANSNVVLLGEAPGKEEVLQGKPFVGRAGRLLTELLEKNKIKRDKLYITNVVKFRPRDGNANRKPTKEEIQACLPYLFKELEIIKPKLIVLLGNTAIKAFFKDIKVLKDHGKLIRNGKTDYFITLHPSAAIRFKKFRVVLEDDFKKLRLIPHNPA